MRRFMLLRLGAIALMFSALYLAAGMQVVYAQTSDTREALWVDKGKAAVKEKLKDPSSATFRKVYFFRGKDNLPVTCGQVNAKNGFGGFTGFKHFVSAGSPENTFLESEVKDFHNLWNRLCT